MKKYRFALGVFGLVCAFWAAPVAGSATDIDKDGVPNHLDQCPATFLPHTFVDEHGCPTKVEQSELVYAELRIFFDNNAAAVKPRYRAEIAKAAKFMKEVPDAVALVEGHASAEEGRAGGQYKRILSEKRADAVKRVLVKNFGIAAKRLHVEAYGADEPQVSNTTPEGRALNRRVDVRIVGVKKTIFDPSPEKNLGSFF